MPQLQEVTVLKKSKPAAVGTKRKAPEKDPVELEPSPVLPADTAVEEPSDTNQTVTPSQEPRQNIASSSGNHANRGRPSASPVWIYFSFNKVTRVATCLLCQKQIANRNQSNAKNHLKVHHKKQYGEVEASESEKKTEKDCPEADKPKLQQQKLVVKSSQTYEPGSLRHKAILRGISLCVATSTVSLNTVENSAFRKLLLLLDPRSPTPGRYAVRTATSELYEELSSSMRRDLAKARMVSWSIDIWSKKGMTESFLGGTAHFHDPTSHEIKHLTLACRSFPPPHDAKSVYRMTEAIVEEWGLKPRQISGIVTDNGSNMVAAYKEHPPNSEFLTESEEAEMIDAESSDEQDAGDCDIDHAQETLDFQRYESDCEKLYAKFKRYSCFIHRLQIPVKSFEKDEKLKPILTKARRIVSAFRHSVTCTRELLSVFGKTLIADVTTRWNSTLLMLVRLLEAKDHVQAITARHLKLAMLTPGEWVALTHTVRLLEKFQKVTEKMSAEEHATIHQNVIYVNGLMRHLEMMNVALVEIDFTEYGMENPFDDVVLRMASEMGRVFGPMVDRKDPKFDGTFFGAALLHPCLRHGLTDDEQDVAKQWILQQYYRWYGTENLTAPEAPGGTQKKPKTVQSHGDDLDFFVDLRSTKPKSPKTEMQKPVVAVELEKYMDEAEDERFDFASDPRIFWRKEICRYPELGAFALDLLAIPASSAPAERLFSTAGLVTQGRSSRLAGLNLERKTEQLTFMFILAFLVISFNFLVMAALGISKSRTRMGFWVLHLALADLLVGLISIPTDIVWQMTYEWYAGNVGCKTIRYAQVVVTFASNYVLVALSIDRYDAIANPLTFTSAVRRSRFLIGSAWFFSFLFSIPMLFLYEQERINGYLQCWLSFTSQGYWKLYFTLVFMTLFLIPVVIIITCFAIVLRTIYVRGRNLEFDEAMKLSRQDSFEGSDRVGSVVYRSKRLAAGTPSNHASARCEGTRGLIPRAKIKTTKMALVIVLVFIACWSPYCIYDLLDVYEHVEFASIQTKIAVSTLMQSLAPLNSVANPIISCIYLRREITRGLRRIHRTLRRRAKRPPTTNFRYSKGKQSGWTDAVLTVPNNSRNSNYSPGDEGSGNNHTFALYNNHVNGVGSKGSRGALV